MYNAVVLNTIKYNNKILQVWLVKYKMHGFSCYSAAQDNRTVVSNCVSNSGHQRASAY